MNQEEFDKRLNESFRNENLPPDTKLWQNISSRLDENSKRPFWVWMVPVVVLVALVGWLVTAPFKHDRKNTAAQPATEQVMAAERTVSSSETDHQPVSGSNDIVVHESDRIQTTPPMTPSATHQNSYNANSLSNNPSTLKHYRRPRNVFSADYFQPVEEPVKVELFPTNLTLNPLVSPLITKYELQKEEPIVYEFPFKDRKTYKSPYSKNPVNYDSKWWWSLGLGPQVAFNKTVVPADSEAWVHKELWGNTKKISGNGTGFQSQFLFGRSLGKHFSVETGLQYSHRTEDIKFNFNSYDIEHRDSFNRITDYVRLKIAVWIGLDTTYYDATRSFSLAVKNKYNVFTLPVKFNFEHNISARTKFVAGIGAGFTAITTKKSAHINLINDRETIDKKAHQFMGSLNAQFGFYTNFNDIGQLGIYSGFQMYTQPWELSNKQYGIQMSDLQLGISFRRPLNW